MLAPTVRPHLNLHAPAAARQLASGWAELLVEVQAQCEADHCGPGCEVRVAVAKVAVSAATLARDLARTPGMVA